MDLLGDFTVARSFIAGRADLKLTETAGISATKQLLRHDFYWQRISTDNLGAEIVKMVDATTLPEGYQVVIQNFSAADDLNVQDSAGGAIKTVPAGQAYLFTLVDNPGAAGTWHSNFLEDGAMTVATRYVDDFIIADFGAPAGGYSTYSVTQATHTRGTQPMFQIFETTGTDQDHVLVDRARVDNAGDLEIRVADGSQFDGRVILI
jgi:hypothetical protein